MAAAKSWLAILAIVRKDIGVWLRQPTAITATILPAIAFMIILYFGAQAVGRNPVALVVQDNGPHAQELVSILNNSDAFKVSLVTSKQGEAEKALKHIQVAAVITIPSNFDIAFNTHKSDPVTIHINNLNLDFTNDLRRSLPAAITEFYSGAPGHNSNNNNNNNNNLNNSIRIHVKETDLRQQDVDLLRFEIVPNMVLLLTTAGIVNAGLATAREWEDSTIKELLLAPISRSSLIAGKLMAGWLTTMLVAAVVLVIGAVTGYLRPDSLLYWLTTIVIIMLIALASVGIGVAIGSAARRFQRVTAVGIPLSIDLFFLSGGITVAAFLPSWLQTVAHFVPTFYGTHALQTSIFYSSTEGLAQDILVLVGTAFGTIALGIFSLRKSTLA
ncbi:MAG TPA: ABC transporter permease [Nitrososphaeraceae archaeon]|nr:ABC transporter permease [Nitrososphaeraceae archaeon]